MNNHEHSAVPTIRAVAAGDLPALKAVIASTGLFPPELLDEMIAPYLAGGSDDFWLAMEDPGRVVAFAYCAPERMTSGTWNLLLIAVSAEHQGRGFGAALMRRVEERSKAAGGRILLVETSSLPDFARTRTFYRREAYVEEARIRDYYQAGEDKIVFVKALVALGDD